MPKINVDGVTREMTPEEIAEMERMTSELTPPEPTEQEILRADVDYLLMMMEG